MKTILATLVLIAAVQVQAAPKKIHFDTVKIDGKPQRSFGFTTIDKKKKKLTVNVLTDPCPVGAACSIEPMQIQTYEAPLQKVTNTGCETLIEGSEDLRAADGRKTTIQVEDNSKNTCETGGLVDSIYKTTVVVEGVSMMTGKASRKVIELKNSRNAP